METCRVCLSFTLLFRRSVFEAQRKSCGATVRPAHIGLDRLEPQLPTQRADPLIQPPLLRSRPADLIAPSRCSRRTGYCPRPCRQTSVAASVTLQAKRVSCGSPLIPFGSHFGSHLKLLEQGGEIRPHGTYVVGPHLKQINARVFTGD